MVSAARKVMLYFISRFWRATKFGVATTQTLVSGGVFLYGVLATGGTLNIVLGAIGLCGSALLFIDSGKVHADIVKAIEKNEQALRAYRTENSKFESENKQLHKSVGALDRSLQKSAKEVAVLQRLRTDYVKGLARFEKQLGKEKQQVDRLETEVDELEHLRVQFVGENSALQQTLSEAREHASSIEELYERTKESDEAHRVQADRLKTIVASMQELLTVVANEGDQFQQFSEAIDTRLIEMDRQNESLENTANMMDTLLNQMTAQRFEALDANNDGKVTKQEFADGLAPSN